MALCTEHPGLVVQTGHSATIRSIAFSPDSKALASASNDKTVLLWNTDTGDQVRALKGHTKEVSSVAFAPNGAFLISGSQDGLARIWETSSGKLIRTIEHPPKIDSVAVSPDGKIVATAGFDRTIKLWNATTGERLRILTGHTGYVTSITFSPDGRNLISGSQDKSIKLWEVASGRLVHSFEGHPTEVAAVTVSTDGRQIASSGGGFNGAGVVIVWDLVSYLQTHYFETHDQVISAVAFSPDGELLLAGTDSKQRALHMWNLRAGEDRMLPTKADAIYALAFSPNGKLLAIAGSDNAITMCDPKTLLELPARTLRGRVQPIYAVSLSAGGKLLASVGHSPTIHVWDLSNGGLRKLVGSEEDVRSVAFSSDGQLLASSTDRQVRVWEVLSAKVRWTQSGHDLPVNCVAFSPDGAVLATGGEDKKLNIWNVANGKKVYVLAGHKDGIHALAFSPDGKILASASADKDIRLWDVTRGTLIRTLAGHDNWVETIAFSPDGQLLASGSVDKKIKLWQVKGTAPPRTLSGHNGAIKTIVFMPGGKQVASGAADRMVKIWDINSGKELKTLSGPSEAVTLVVYPTGDLIAMWTDQQITLFDVTKGRSLAILTVLDDSEWAVVDEPDGRFDASDGGMLLMHWALGTEPIELDQLKRQFWEPRLLVKLLNQLPLISMSSFENLKLDPDVVEVAPVEPGSSNVAIKLTNRGGGIGQVQILVNDKEIIKDARGANFDPSISKATVRADLKGAPFVRGQPNRVRVVASTSANNPHVTTAITRRSATLTYTPSVSAEPTQGDLYAIVAGISDYASPILRKLDYAPKDAADFSKALTLGAKKDQFRALHMHVLTSDGSPENQPNKVNFTKVFDELKQTKPTDMVVVFFAGHGISLPGTPPVYCYLTNDAKITNSSDLADAVKRRNWAITSDELAGWMTGKDGAKALRQVMILDTCEAGVEADTLPWQHWAPAEDDVRLSFEDLKDRTGFHVLMGCGVFTKNMFAREHVRYQHGLLTYALLEGMSGAALQERKFVDVSSLFDYAIREVRSLAYEIGRFQQPQKACQRGTTFTVGELSQSDQAVIPVVRVKPVFVRPHFSDRNPTGAVDPLKLSSQLSTRLTEASRAPKPGTNRSLFDYVDVDEMARAIEVNGKYNVDHQDISLDLVLLQNSQVIHEAHFRSPANDMAKLLDQIVDTVDTVCDNLPPTSVF